MANAVRAASSDIKVVLLYKWTHNLTHNVCSKLLGNEDKQPPPLVEKLAGISRESLLRGAVVEEDTDVQDVHQMTQAAYVMCIPLLRVNHTHSS